MRSLQSRGKCDDDSVDRVGRLEDPTLADWTLLANLHGKRVLWAGEGRGLATDFVAGQVGSLVLLDSDVERLDEQYEACRRNGFDDVTPVRATPPLPFASDSFESVVVEDFCRFTHAASGEDEGAGQQSMLAEIRRVLVPGGVLLFSAENRFGPLILARLFEEETDLWTRVRHVAAALASRHVNDVRSRRGYDQLLSATGFTDVTFQYAIPDQRRPDYIFSHERLLSEFLSTRTEQFPAGGALLDTLSRRYAGMVCPAYIVRANAP